MSYTPVFTEQYNKRAPRFLKQHPPLRPQYLKTLQLLQANPFHPSLRLHALKSKLDGLHSVSINLSHRITLELLIHNKNPTIILESNSKHLLNYAIKNMNETQIKQYMLSKPESCEDHPFGFDTHVYKV